MRRLVFYVLCLLALAACAARGPSPHVLRIADIVDPPSLDPLLAHDQATIGYDLLICDTLIGLDAQNRLVPILVTRVPTRGNGDISPDGTRITYHLRRNVRFADGVAFTSADVAFTYRAILDSRNAVLSQDAYRRIASLRTPDRFTVVVRLKQPWNAAVSELFAQSDFAFGILPSHAFQSTELKHAAWEQKPFGSGPFRVAEWRRGDRIILEPNPYHSPKPKLSRIVLRIIPDATSAFIALRTHEVDVAPLYPEMLGDAGALHGIVVHRTPENATFWLTLQTAQPPTSDPNIRRAIAYALDIRSLRDAYQGVYENAAAFLPPALQWHDSDILAYPYDPQTARRLLGGKHIDALFVTSSETPLFTRIATNVQQQLAQVGIHVTIKQFPLALFNAPEGPIRNERFTITLDGWIGGADPEQSIVFLCSQANVNGNNISRFCDPRFEALFADQERTRSEQRRREDFIQMQQMVHDQVPVVPIYYESWFDGLDSHVRGFERNMLRYPVAPEGWDD
jgi:peptide/nickel transport system substrate-binding protein